MRPPIVHIRNVEHRNLALRLHLNITMTSGKDIHKHGPFNGKMAATKPDHWTCKRVLKHSLNCFKLPIKVIDRTNAVTQHFFESLFSEILNKNH